MADSFQGRVLVIDDNEQNRLLAEGSLVDEGYDVVLAANGTDGIEAFQRQRFECVLLDVRMPGLNGFEVCRALRALPHGREVSILFLTALRDIDTFEAAHVAGGDDFLTKPLSPAELVVRVRTALQLRRFATENRELVDTIREQRDAMTRLSLQKERLTAFLVHDLKNPVNSLDLHAQLLLRNKTLSDNGKQSVRAIRHEAARLIQLIENMLDISKGEAGELSLHKVELDLCELVAAVGREFEVRAHSKELKLESEVEPEMVTADAGLLRRVLENLVDNAIRHAPQGSTVWIRAARAGNVMDIVVADEGTGVPDAMKQAVFERFVQGTGAKERRSSYGLGLAFCKLVIEAHGGTVSVEDGSPGAVFHVRLPA
ncbi:MAG TPA: hybrid sensor histidine kinase/response regulator [Polyangiales bacterium]